MSPRTASSMVSLGCRSPAVMTIRHDLALSPPGATAWAPEATVETRRAAPVRPDEGQSGGTGARLFGERRGDSGGAGPRTFGWGSGCARERDRPNHVVGHLVLPSASPWADALDAPLRGRPPFGHARVDGLGACLTGRAELFDDRRGTRIPLRTHCEPSQRERVPRGGRRVGGLQRLGKELANGAARVLLGRADQGGQRPLPRSAPDVAVSAPVGDCRGDERKRR